MRWKWRKTFRLLCTHLFPYTCMRIVWKVFLCLPNNHTEFQKMNSNECAIFFFAFLIIFRNDWKTRYWSWIILNCWLLWKRFNSADVYVNQSFTQSVIKTAIKEKIERTPHIDISHGAHETHSYILISVLFPFNWYFSINSYQNEPLSDGDGKNTKIK